MVEDFAVFRQHMAESLQLSGSWFLYTIAVRQSLAKDIK
jgi:hypothetical protein